MNKEQKNIMIQELADKLADNKVIYLADVSELTAEDSSKLRRACFKQQVSLSVVKNTLLKKAMEKVEDKDFSEFYDQLKGPTSLMLSDTGNVPAKLIQEFRKKNDKPLLKAAYVEESVYVGDENLTALAELKSKNELVAEVLLLLQSPAKTVISSLQSGGNTVSGLVKALEERAS